MARNDFNMETLRVNEVKRSETKRIPLRDALLTNEHRAASVNYRLDGFSLEMRLTYRVFTKSHAGISPRTRCSFLSVPFFVPYPLLPRVSD